jgi:hypothetical protein
MPNNSRGKNTNERRLKMLSWVKYLVYIMSFLIPPVGVITFWVSSGRGKELEEVAKWSFFAAFVGLVVWCIVAAVGLTMHGMFWHCMGR